MCPTPSPPDPLSRKAGEGESRPIFGNNCGYLPFPRFAGEGARRADGGGGIAASHDDSICRTSHPHPALRATFPRFAQGCPGKVYEVY